MTTTTENQTAKPKQVPLSISSIFESADRQKGGKSGGAAFIHKKGKVFALLIGGNRFTAFAPKVKRAAQPEQLGLLRQHRKRACTRPLPPFPRRHGESS